jgi:hypothetical protein
MHFYLIVMEDRWTRLISRHIKLNVDAAYYDESKSKATKSILREFEGIFL